MKNSVDEFKQLINNYDQKIIHPVIDEILTNFEHNLNVFQASEEAWEKLANLEIKLCANYKYLVELIKNGYIKSKIHKDKINNFFIRDENNKKNISKSDHIKVLYKYKKILSGIITRIKKLLAFEDNESAYKPIHFIFAFVHDQQKLEQLIDKYSLNANDKTKHNSATIHFAAELGNIQGVELLINKFHVDINIKNNNNCTALHYIANEGHLELLTKILLYPNLILNIQDVQGNTPLYRAISGGWLEVTESLLANKANFNINNNNGNNALWLSSNAGYVDIFKMIVSCFQQREEFDIDQTNDQNLTLLQLVTYIGNRQLVKCLIKDYQADINLAPNYKYPLMIAIDMGHEPILRYLLEHGAYSLRCIFQQNSNFASTELCSKIAIVLSLFEDYPKSIETISQTGGIFFNKFYIIDIISNWYKFNPNLKNDKDFLDDAERAMQANADIDIITLNKLKTNYLMNIANDMACFFCIRQMELIVANKYKNDFTKLIIDQKKLFSNLAYKTIINAIMSGDILLCDEKIDSTKIIEGVGKCVKVFLFHKSKFLNEKFEYQGKTESEDKIFINTSRSIFDSDLHLMNPSNYQAIERFKNEYFFKIIGVIKESLKLNDHAETKEESSKKTGDEISEVKEQKELAKSVWESEGILSLIASHLSVEGYFNSLKQDEAVNPSDNNIKTTNHTLALGQTIDVSEADLSS